MEEEGLQKVQCLLCPSYPCQTILDNYKYTDIVTWGHSDEKFILVVGNVVQQRKLVFKTRDVREVFCGFPRLALSPRVLCML